MIRSTYRRPPSDQHPCARRAFSALAGPGRSARGFAGPPGRLCLPARRRPPGTLDGAAGARSRDAVDGGHRPQNREQTDDERLHHPGRAPNHGRPPGRRTTDLQNLADQVRDARARSLADTMDIVLQRTEVLSVSAYLQARWLSEQEESRSAVLRQN